MFCYCDELVLCCLLVLVWCLGDLLGWFVACWVGCGVLATGSEPCLVLVVFVIWLLVWLFAVDLWLAGGWLVLVCLVLLFVGLLLCL